MTKMKVELIDSAGGDLSVVNSARVSFNKEVGEVEEKDEKLINYLARHNNMTPFRHNFVQLRCKVPLFLARQLMKHQAGLTWNEESRRYVDDMPEFYTPKEWRGRPEGSIKQGSKGSVKNDGAIQSWYRYHVESCKENYRELLENGVATEMARMILPQSMMVNFIWSGNLLAFAHVYKLRIGEGSQEEAKEFAGLLGEVIKPKFPISWTAVVE